VTIGAVLVHMCVVLASAVAFVMRRVSKRQQRRSARRSVEALNAIIAVAAVTAFMCGLAFLPGGPLFDSTFLFVAFTLTA
jgi:multisubunit Na+/H+ antiporter MnhB subunit